MFLLVLCQEKKEVYLGCFDHLEDGQAFVEKLIEDLDLADSLDENGDLLIQTHQLPDYVEIDFKGHLIPISRMSFDPGEAIWIEWREVANLSQKGTGIVEGMTLIDGYYFDNEEVKDYLSQRDNVYQKVSSLLASKGYEVKQDLMGSEDGTAIFYRKKGESDWNFLLHLDPSFVIEPWSEAEILSELE